MKTKWKVLRIIATICRVLGVLALVGGVLTLLVLIGVGGLAGREASAYGSTSGISGMIGGALGMSIVGAIYLFACVMYSLFLFACAEAVYLVIAVEENTRRTMLALRPGGEELLEAA